MPYSVRLELLSASRKRRCRAKDCPLVHPRYRQNIINTIINIFRTIKNNVY